MEKKKSVSVKNKNEIVSTYIPDDISFSILSKLPLKSFKRFESVRKSWSLLSQNTHFMNMFRNNFLSSNSHYDGASLFLKVIFWRDMSQMQVLYLSGHRFQNMLKFDFSNPFNYKRYFQIFGFSSIAGILSLHQQSRYKHHLWHRPTQKFKILPPSPFESYINSR
jgi:molecular chaperone HtpG